MVTILILERYIVIKVMKAHMAVFDEENDEES